MTWCDDLHVSTERVVGCGRIIIRVGKEAYRKPFTWMLTGSPTLSVYGITLPFSFTISEQQRNFRQPFNKFGVSPYYKWAKLAMNTSGKTLFINLELDGKPSRPL